jgi:hypothetical protein
MKKVSSLLILFVAVAVTTLSCKSDKNSDSEGLKDKKSLSIENEYMTLTGEFIHVDTAAVLKVKNKLYGVKMDDMAKSVIEKAETIKTDDYDVINIDIKAEINPNTEPEGWEEIVTIKVLDNIYKPQPKQETKVLKYSSNKTE